MIDIVAIKARFETLAPYLDERARRLLAATEARAAGRGGVAAVSAATGVARALSHCLKYSRAKSQAPFSGNLAANCFPFGHGVQAVISDLKC
jgi:hypothetical protein